MSFVSRIRSIMQKSVNANSDGYDFAKFKKWAIEHIKKQIQDNSSDDMKKSLEHGDFSVCKAFSIVEEMQKAVYPVGTIREWKGRKYIKVSPGKWKPKYDSMTRGAKASLTRILHSLEKCSNDKELYAIISQANARFRDDNGKLLPEAQIIYDNHKTASRGIENGKKIDSLYEKNLKRIKELEKQGKSDDDIDNDEIIKKNKEEMKNVGKKEEKTSETNKKELSPEDALFIGMDITDSTPASLENAIKVVEHEIEMNNKPERFIESDKKELENLKYCKDIVERLSKRDSLSGEEKEKLINELKNIKKLSEKSTNTKQKKIVKTKVSEIISNLESEKKDDKNESYSAKTSENNEVKEKKDKESIRIKWAQEKMRNKNLHKDYDDLAGKIMDIDLAIYAIDRKGRSIVGDKEIKDLSADEKNEVYKLGKERSRLNDKMKELVDEQNETKYQISISDKKIVDLEEEFEDAESKEKNSNSYWITDKKGNRMTIDDAKKRIESNWEKIDKIAKEIQGKSKADIGRNDLDIRELKNEIDSLVEKMNPEDREKMHTQSKLHYDPDVKAPEYTQEFADEKKKQARTDSQMRNDAETKKEKPDFSKMSYSERVDYIRNNPVSSEERKLINHLNDVDNAAKKLTGNETASDIQKKIDAKQKQLDAVDKKDLTKINKVGWELDELKNMKEAIEKKGNENSTSKDDSNMKKSYTERVNEIKNSIEDLTRY